MKPIIEWLKEIADPTVRERAIAVCRYPNMIVDTLLRAVSEMCDWVYTPQGYLYWNDVFKVIVEHGNYPASAPPAEEGQDVQDEIWNEAFIQIQDTNNFSQDQQNTILSALIIVQSNFTITRKTTL